MTYVTGKVCYSRLIPDGILPRGELKEGSRVFANKIANINCKGRERKRDGLTFRTF